MSGVRPFKKMSVAAVQASLILMTGSACYAAGGKFGNDSDILGLRLTMSPDEASKFMRDAYPGTTVIPIPVGLSSGSYAKKADAGFVVDLASKSDNEANQRKGEQQQADLAARKAAGFGDSPLNRTVGSVGDVAQDRVKVLFNPNDNAKDIFAISRYTEYTADKQPVTKTMTDALMEKYGLPSRTAGEKNSFIIYEWAEAGVLERTKSAMAKCYTEGSTGSDFFYEGVGASGFYGMPQLLQFTSERFANVINLVNSKNPFSNYANCGKILEIRLKLTRNGDYVGSMAAKLIDLSRGYAELGAFGNSSLAGAAAARQNQLNSAAGNKPKL